MFENSSALAIRRCIRLAARFSLPFAGRPCRRSNGSHDPALRNSAMDRHVLSDARCTVLVWSQTALDSDSVGCAQDMIGRGFSA